MLLKIPPGEHWDEATLRGVIAQLKERLKRRAIVMDIGVFDPPDDPKSSWFGWVGFARPGEAWPEWQGRPMTPICQVNVEQLPFRPQRLEDVGFFTLFFSGGYWPVTGGANGDGWCLRTYRTAEEVDWLDPPSEAPEGFSTLPMRHRALEADYPQWEDLPREVRDASCEDLFDVYEEELETAGGFKLGGWPFSLQGGLDWNTEPSAGDTGHEPQGRVIAGEIRPEHVIQVDSVLEAGLNWVDCGYAFFGRGTAPGHENEWTWTWDST